jgi:hypothetical protein
MWEQTWTRTWLTGRTRFENKVYPHEKSGGRNSVVVAQQTVQSGIFEAPNEVKSAAMTPFAHTVATRQDQTG